MIGPMGLIIAKREKEVKGKKQRKKLREESQGKAAGLKFGGYLGKKRIIGGTAEGVQQDGCIPLSYART